MRRALKLVSQGAELCKAGYIFLSRFVCLSESGSKYHDVFENIKNIENIKKTTTFLYFRYCFQKMKISNNGISYITMDVTRWCSI